MILLKCQINHKTKANTQTKFQQTPITLYLTQVSKHPIRANAGVLTYPLNFYLLFTQLKYVTELKEMLKTLLLQMYMSIE